MLKKIRIQRVSIFDIVATLVLAVVLVAFAAQGTGELAQMQTATDDYIQCETLARQLQSGSDYLIEQVRMYTATGQREYMDNYFEELNATCRRENALEYFAEHYGDTDAFTLLKSAMTTSQNLSYTDRYAMRLVAQATLADESSWPTEIRSVSLHDSDITMTDSEKMRKAQQLVCNDQYQNMRDEVNEKITESMDSLIALTRSRQNGAQTVFTGVYRKIELCAALLVLLMLEICMITRYLVVKPLMDYGQSIRRGEIFPVVGAAELQDLALTYNEVYRENQETQKIIRHEAEHDALTGALPAKQPGKMPQYAGVTALPLYSCIVPVPPRQPLPGMPGLPLLLARRLGAVLGVPVETPLYIKRRGRPQKELTREQRLQNARGAFGCCPGTDLTGRRVLLIDDIITTGATASACALALLEAGAVEVTAVAIAAAEELPKSRKKPPETKP